MARYHRKLVDKPGWRVTYSRRTRDEHMGRFGGGWQWALGFEAGARHRDGAQTVIVNLLVCSVRVEYKPKTPRRPIR